MPLLRFIHAADLHLDSPFIGLEQLGEGFEHVASTLREATFRAFDTVIRLCIEKQVDFLLVAGDVYDGADRSLKAQLSFREGLVRLSKAGIHTFVIHGNHDPLNGRISDLKMPDLVTVFGSKLSSESYKKDGESVARVHGISYPKRDISPAFGKGFKREGPEPFQIGLFHCNAGGQEGYDPYAPRTVEELTESGLDYWALGHIHENKILKERNPFIGYPGNTQGRHINESGRRGCFIVTVSEDGKTSDRELVATDAVRWLRGALDISSMETVDDLTIALESKVDELQELAEGRNSIARVTLSGRGPMHSTLSNSSDAQEILSRLRDSGASESPFVWIEKLDIQTRPAVDIEKRRESPDFLGDLLNLIQEFRTSPQCLDQLKEPLNELFSHTRAGKLLDSPDEGTLLKLLEEAETRCVDLLAEGDK
ncbi:MAG: DNA repair exonuclease [Planctomycetota bacterium]|nr:DNA repair exonuclease [Planctomycetota bacterium]MDA1137051.1 DNA repair exonuclease [Planctomycetota bacterium]